MPSLDGVAFIDPKRSQVDITQAVGRAIRKSPGKEIGTIVLPVFVRPGDDARAMVEASDFRDVWGVIAALRAQDPSLGAELDAIRSRMGREPGYRPATQDLSRIVIDMPLTVGFEVGDAIRTAVVEQGTDTWEFWFGLLVAYMFVHMHFLVPGKHMTSDGSKLGRWVGKQRTKRDTMGQERREMLEALAGWTWNALDAEWEEEFGCLTAYVATNGNCRVTRSYGRAEGSTLGQWVTTQRTKRDTMNAARRERLEALAGWTWDVLETQWEEAFRHLEEYVAEHGHSRAPDSHVSGNGFRLGAWVRKKRANQRTLTSNRRSSLEALPRWTWDAHDAKWDDNFLHLKTYVLETGHSQVPETYMTADGYQLGTWVTTQRTKHHSMSAERRDLLEALSGWSWNIPDAKWEEGFAHLNSYLNTNGNLLIPLKHVTSDGFRLGAWVNRQRSNRAVGTSERITWLEALPGWTWNILDVQWEGWFSRLKDYITAWGNCRVPKNHSTPDGYALGAWVSKQRNRHRATMNSSRRGRLEALPGWAWEVRPRKHMSTFKTAEGSDNPG